MSVHILKPRTPESNHLNPTVEDLFTSAQCLGMPERLVAQFCMTNALEIDESYSDLCDVEESVLGLCLGYDHLKQSDAITSFHYGNPVETITRILAMVNYKRDLEQRYTMPFASKNLLFQRIRSTLHQNPIVTWQCVDAISLQLLKLTSETASQ